MLRGNNHDARPKFTWTGHRGLSDYSSVSVESVATTVSRTSSFVI